MSLLANFHLGVPAAGREMGIRRRQQWHAVAALGVAWCAAAAAVAVAAADGRNASLLAGAAAAAAPEETGAARQQHGDGGKAYHHVWPVTHAQQQLH